MASSGVDEELSDAERRLARLERIENPVSVLGGIALAIPYFLWWWAHHYLALYSWIFPFLLGGMVTKLVFAKLEANAERKRDQIASPGLPEARLLEGDVVHHPTPKLPRPPMIAPDERIASTTFASPTAVRWHGTSNWRAMSSTTRDVDMLITTGPRS